MGFAGVLAILLSGCGCGGGEGGGRDAGGDAGPRDDGGARDVVLGPLADAGPWDGAIAEPAAAQEPRIPWLSAGEPDVAPPAPPAAPMLTPCASGWRQVPPDPSVPGSPLVCDPWPATGRAVCDIARGLAHFPGEDGCASVGSACAVDGWPTGLPVGRPVLHVRAGAPAGGDGTRAAPFATIAEAIAAATGPAAGAVIALAAGRYFEDVTIPAGVALWGACASGTRIAGSYDEAAATLRPSGADVEIRDLTISGDRPGIRVGPGASVRVEDVIVDVVLGAGMWVSGGTLDARTVVIRGTRPRRTDSQGGYGLDVTAGTAVVSRAVFDRNTQRAIGSVGMLTLRDAALLDTRVTSGDEWGHGLSIEGGTALAERVTIERSHAFGVYALSGADVTVRDAVVRDTQPRARDDQLGQGVYAAAGASVTLERVLLSGNHQVGAEAANAGTRLAIRDSVIRDTQPQRSSNDFGYGIYCSAGATVTAAAVAVERNHHDGVASSVCTLDLADLTVRDTSPRARDGAGGDGMALTDGARATVRRLLAERNRRYAVYALEAGTTLTLEDAMLRETALEESSRDKGRGLLAGEGAVVDAQRLVIDQAHTDGVLARGAGTRVRLADVRIARIVRPPDSVQANGIHVQGANVVVDRLVVRDVATTGLIARPPDMDAPCPEPHLLVRDASIEGLGSYALIASFGGCATAERLVARGGFGYGVSILGPGSRADLTDVVIADTESFLDSLVPGQEGAGIQVGGGTLEGTRLLLTNNRLAGIVVGAYQRDDVVTPSAAVVTDLVVRDTRAQLTPAEGGYGVQLGGPSTLHLTRALFERNRAAGLWVTDTSRLTGSDVVVRDMRSTEIVGVHGEGISALGEGRAELERVLVERARSTGVIAIDPGASVHLVDAVIRETLEAECGVEACEGTAYGVGAGAYYGGSVTLARFRISESAICGVQVAAGGVIDLAHGEVAMQPIGANVQDPEYDLRRLMQDVVYRENRVNLDASSLPVPGR